MKRQHLTIISSLSFFLLLAGMSWANLVPASNPKQSRVTKDDKQARRTLQQVAEDIKDLADDHGTFKLKKEGAVHDRQGDYELKINLTTGNAPVLFVTMKSEEVWLTKPGGSQSSNKKRSADAQVPLLGINRDTMSYEKGHTMFTFTLDETADGKDIYHLTLYTEGDRHFKYRFTDLDIEHDQVVKDEDKTTNEDFLDIAVDERDACKKLRSLIQEAIDIANAKK